MFDRSIEPEAMLCLALCDSRGKGGAGEGADHEPFLRERLAAYEQCLSRPAVMGRDLLEAGLEPGPDFSHLLAHARKLHLAGVDRDSALKQTLAYARKGRKKRKTT